MIGLGIVKLKAVDVVADLHCVKVSNTFIRSTRRAYELEI
jgi:hypothetical protein